MAKILVVDDSAVARRQLREIFVSLGHAVVGEAENGAQAFAEYVRLRPNIVTMDLSMQGLAGAQVISKIIAGYPDACIIVVSATEERSVIIDALERGARHFIIKPIQKEKVATVLDTLLKQPFVLAQHKDKISRLKLKSNACGDETTFCASPYTVCAQDKRLVYVTINQSITLTSWQSLQIELSEHIQDKVRLLLDFGSINELGTELLELINKLICTVEEHSGQVRAISSNKHFIDQAALLVMTRTPNLLTDVLQYYDR